MSYIFLPTKISVCFYDMSYDFRGKFISFLTLTNLHHCGIMLEREDKKIILTSEKTHKTRFMDANKFHNRMGYPTEVVELGIHQVSITQLSNFLHSSKHSYRGDFKSLFCWYIAGRFLFPLVKPPSCGMITVYLLRICGIEVKDHVEPRTLYKELTQHQ
jgi:hypothetical protein